MRKDQAKFDKAFEFIRADSDPPDSAADGLRALSLKSYESYKLMIMSEHSKFISSELNSLKTQVLNLLLTPPSHSTHQDLRTFPCKDGFCAAKLS